MEDFTSDMHFGHGEDIHGDTLHGLVRNRRPLGFPPDILTIGIAGLATILDLLDGIVEADVIDLKPALHV